MSKLNTKHNSHLPSLEERAANAGVKMGMLKGQKFSSLVFLRGRIDPKPSRTDIYYMMGTTMGLGVIFSVDARTLARFLRMKSSSDCGSRKDYIMTELYLVKSN